MIHLYAIEHNYFEVQGGFFGRGFVDFGGTAVSEKEEGGRFGPRFRFWSRRKKIGENGGKMWFRFRVILSMMSDD